MDRDDLEDVPRRLSSGLWVPGGIGDADESQKVLLLAEIDSSISFINVEFVVCTALLLFNVDALDDAPFAGAAMVISVVAFLFGGLCVANAGGSLARGDRSFSEAIRALNWGNIFTEWFGVYMLVFALPAIVEVSSPGSPLGGVTLAAAGVAYAAYVLNGFDILRRLLGSRPAARFALHGLTLIGTALHWGGVAFECAWYSAIGAGVVVAVVLTCAVTHARSHEFSRGHRLGQ